MDQEQMMFRFFNTEEYSELLKYVPHRSFGDLSILYYQIKENEQQNQYGMLITNAQAEQMNMTEPELYEQAYKNTRELFPAVIAGLGETVKEMLLCSGRELGEEEAEAFERATPYLLVSNEKYQFGAVSILYEDVMNELVKRLGNDLYLVPSSVHEWIAMPAAGEDAEDLSEFVRLMNLTKVIFPERLSNQVYHYDGMTKQFSLASHNPHTSLREVSEEEIDEESGQDESVDMQMQ